MKLEAGPTCLSCYHSRCTKERVTCVLTRTEAKERCAKYEAIAGRPIPKDANE